MESIIKDQENNWPFLADFNDCDMDGDIRGFSIFTTMDFKNVKIEPREGQKVWLSDGEVELFGILHFKNGFWVAIPDEGGFKDVDKKTPYHSKNLKRK